MPTKTKQTTQEVKKIKRDFRIFEKLQKLNLVLGTIFLVLWIFIGGFFSFSIVQNLQMMAGQNNIGPIDNTSQSELPQETQLPGVGKVNVACVQSEVSPEVIQKVFQDNGTENLSEEEKSTINNCVVKEDIEEASEPAPAQ